MDHGPSSKTTTSDSDRKIDRLLHDTDSLYLSLVENLPVSVLRKDVEGRIVFANERFCEEVGKTFDELQGLTDYDLFPAELAEKYLENDRDVMRQGDVFHDVEEHSLPDGRCRYVELFKSPVKDKSGKVTGLQCIYWDVTERHQMEAQLSYERHLLDNLMDHLPDSIYFKDLDSRFLRVNKGLTDKFDLDDPAEAIGRTDADFFSHEHYREAREDELRIIESGQPILGIVEREVWPDGRESWCSTSKLPLRDENGKVIGTFGVSRDITLQKKAQEDLRLAKEAADEANKAKSDFLANMSHEIRTPMNGIIGMSELLMNTELAPEQREYLNMVKQSADALMRLLNDILDFSKIEAGKLELESINFHLRDTVTNTVRTLSARAAEKGIELACRVDPEIPDFMQGDPGRLRQIIVNLVGNAIKFTESGEVYLNVEPREIGDNAVQLLFSVSDTGIGIPKEKQDRIFQSFEQVDTSTTRRFGGTGLGLTISSQLVDLMDGRIWLESEVGSGTTFYFTVSFAPVGEENFRKPADLDQFEGMRVLVVDDNKTNRRILEEVLNNWGMIPVLAESGSEGLAELYRSIHEENPIRLVLLDCMMPGMNGFQFAELVRANPDFDDSVMIMISSAIRAGDASRCRDLNIVRCVTKPVKQSELLDTILTKFDLSAVSKGRSGDLPDTEASVTTKRVLLAEDGLVNQEVAVGFLKQRGHQVTVVENGQLAVEALQREQFDVILMDIQMPVMDGLQATRLIRERENETGDHIPIIAMTANAMKGDRQRCLDVGMDAYLSKPVDREELCRLVETTYEPESASRPIFDQSPDVVDSETSEESSHKPMINWQRMSKKLPGGMAGVRKLSAMFLTESQTKLDSIRNQIHDEGKLDDLRRACHTLKSSAGMFECEPLEELAFELEQLAEQGAREEFESRICELEELVKLTQQCCDRFLSTTSESS